MQDSICVPVAVLRCSSVDDAIEVRFIAPVIVHRWYVPSASEKRVNVLAKPAVRECSMPSDNVAIDCDSEHINRKE